MHAVTREEMRRLDRHTIEQIGIPSAVLMENAGRVLAEAVQAVGRAADAGEVRPLRVLILAGKGNNGGDGLVAARHLRGAGMEAEVVYAEPPSALRGDAALQRDIADRLGIRAQLYGKEAVRWDRFDVVVDALLGTGSKGAPRGAYAALIREANASGRPIVAADIPSGLDADTGAVEEPCIRAKCTVTFAFPKLGLLQHPGAEYAGRVKIAPIGIPEALADELGVHTFVLDERVFREKLRLDPRLPRGENSHKGMYGHALIAAGSRPMSGAALLSAKAALRAGAGLATLAVPDRLVEPLIGRVPELMLAGLPDGGTGEWSALGAPGPARDSLLALAEGKRSVLFGPGMGRFEGDAAWLRAAWEAVAAPLVLDADALNMLADAGGFAHWPERPSGTVLTPHPGEMARLAGISAGEVQRDRIGLARSFAVRHRVTLVLKGSRTVVAGPDGNVYVNVTGNPGMATGGSGDVLAGVIAGLLAQGLAPVQAAALGVFRHGAAGDRAQAMRPSSGSLLAGEILEAL